MPALNQLTMLGNLTRDVQLSYTPNGTAVADVGLAVNRKWRGGDGTERESVCFIDCRAFGKLAETLAKHQKKGNLILFTGYLDLEQWEKAGTKHSRHRMIVDHAQFMPDGKPHGREAGDEPIFDGGIPL